MKQLFLMFFAIIFSFQSCKNNEPKEPLETLKEIAQETDINIGNVNFEFDLPEDWYRIDTILQGFQLCVLLNNDETYKPRINITNESMHGKAHNNYISGTKQYLTKKMSGIEILEDGQFKVSGKNCVWYSYNMAQNGIKREMIFYSIANDGISYNITAGLNPGGLKKYRETIDEIIRTFKLN